MLALALFGLSDSLYLAQSETSNTPLICSVENLSDCNAVVSSAYAHLFGISIAEYGVIFYALIFIIAALELVFFDQLFRRILQVFSLIGIIVSTYLTGIEMFVIHAWCIYCIASAFTSLFLFVFACLIEPIRRNRKMSPSLEMQRPPSRLTMPPSA